MASYLPNLARDNISYYVLPAAWVVAIAPRFWAANAYIDKAGEDINAFHPRDTPRQAEENSAIDKKTEGRIVRAEAAQANGFEHIGLFAAAVTAGNAAGLDPAVLNGLSIGYVLSRLVYNHVYIYNDLLPPAVRSVTYVSGIGMIMALFIQAGNRMKRTIL